MKRYVRGVISTNDGIVLGLQKPTDIYRHKVTYQLPGGKKEETDSSDEEALVREIQEELGVEASELVHLGEAISPNSGNLHVFYLVRRIEGNLKINPQELNGIGFYHPGSQIPDNLLHPTIKNVDGFWQQNDLDKYNTSGLILPEEYIKNDSSQQLPEKEYIDWKTQQQNFEKWAIENSLSTEGQVDRR